jgi:hypothetical protein
MWRLWSFPKSWGFPQIIHVDWGFPIFFHSKPTILVIPHEWKSPPPMGPIDMAVYKNNKKHHAREKMGKCLGKCGWWLCRVEPKET